MVRTNLSACAFRFGDRGQLDGLHAGAGKHVQKLRREQRVAVVNQVSLPHQDSFVGIGNIPADLAHPDRSPTNEIFISIASVDHDRLRAFPQEAISSVQHTFEP